MARARDDVGRDVPAVRRVKSHQHLVQDHVVQHSNAGLAAPSVATHYRSRLDLSDALVVSGTTAIAYETVQTADGALPLLAPMSEVAGRMAPQVGAHSLERAHGGRGVLLGGVSGVYAAKVVVIGAGVSGMNAAAIALGMQAEVLLLDKNVAKLREVDRIYQGHAQTIASNLYEVERAVLDADELLFLDGEKLDRHFAALDDAGAGDVRKLALDIRGRMRAARKLRYMPDDEDDFDD